MTNFKVMLTIIRDYSTSTRAIRNAGDYQDIFGPMPEVEREIPARIQPPRGSTHGVQARDVVTVSTDLHLHHMYGLAETYGPPKDYNEVPITVEEVFTKDVINYRLHKSFRFNI